MINSHYENSIYYTLLIDFYSTLSLFTTLIFFIIINLPECQEEEAQGPQADHHSVPANPPPSHNEPPNKPTPQLPLNNLEVCSLVLGPL